MISIKNNMHVKTTFVGLNMEKIQFLTQRQSREIHINSSMVAVIPAGLMI